MQKKNDKKIFQRGLVCFCDACKHFKLLSLDKVIEQNVVWFIILMLPKINIF